MLQIIDIYSGTYLVQPLNARDSHIFQEMAESMKPFALYLVRLLLYILAVAYRLEAQTTPREIYAPASPKTPWQVVEPTIDPIISSAPHQEFSWVDVLLWLPNRLMDFVDIFRFDIGLGPSHGAVVRLTRYAQAGYRDMSPASVRLGMMGRRVPFMTEKSKEYGVSPYYHPSQQRKVCPGEVGGGVDLLIFGVYGGICLDELADFATGVFFLDLKKDDLKSQNF